MLKVSEQELQQSLNALVDRFNEGAERFVMSDNESLQVYGRAILAGVCETQVRWMADELKRDPSMMQLTGTLLKICAEVCGGLALDGKGLDKKSKTHVLSFAMVVMATLCAAEEYDGTILVRLTDFDGTEHDAELDLTKGKMTFDGKVPSEDKETD